MNRDAIYQELKHADNVPSTCHPAPSLRNEAVERSEDHVAAEDSCQRERVDYGEHVICGVAQAKVNA